MLLHLLADASDRKVVVVGCGSAGAEKAARLAAAGAKVTAIDPAPGVLPETPGIRREHRPFEPSDVEGAWLVVAATDHERVNDAVVTAAVGAGAWVVRADRPDGGGVAFAAVLERGPVQIGVSTGGISPSLARWIRDRVERALPPAVETMAQLLAQVPRRDGRRGHRGIDFDEVVAAIEAGDEQRAKMLLSPPLEMET